MTADQIWNKFVDYAVKSGECERAGLPAMAENFSRRSIYWLNQWHKAIAK